MRLTDLPSGVQADLLAANGLSRPKAKAKASQSAELFDFHLRSHGFTSWQREYRFAWEKLRRQWRFDFALVEHQLAVEIEGLRVQKIGGKWVCTGRHSTPDGFREDLRKYNSAAELGWIVLRFDQKLVKTGAAIATVERVLSARGVARA